MINPWSRTLRNSHRGFENTAAESTLLKDRGMRDIDIQDVAFTTTGQLLKPLKHFSNYFSSLFFFSCCTSTSMEEDGTAPGLAGELLQSMSLWAIALPVATLLFVIAFRSLFHLLFFNLNLLPDNHTERGSSMYVQLLNFINLVRNRERNLDFITELFQKSASLTARISRPGMPGIVTANPDNIEYILKTKFNIYPKGSFVRTTMDDFLGHGIFNADGENWKFQRKIAIQEFSTRYWKDFTVESVKEEIGSRLLPTLKHFSQLGRSFDLQNLLSRFSLDTISKVTFGSDPACLDSSLPAVAFAEAFDIASHITAGRFMSIHPLMWKAMRALKVGPERRLREAVNVVNKFAMSVIRTRRREFEEARGKGGNNNIHLDLLSRFMSSEQSQVEQDLVNKIQERSDRDKFLRDVVISFLMAGTDSTSVGLSWFFWVLSRQPVVEQRCYDEIKRLFDERSAAQTVKESTDEESRTLEHQVNPAKQAPGGSYSLLSYDELLKLNYLQAAISESLRLYPPVPSNARLCIRDDVLPDGTFVHKNTIVFYHTYAAARMESIWGEDCLDFKPERWLKEGKFIPENPRKYPVFHLGPRICLGKDLAMTTMKYVASSIIYHFHLTAVDPNLTPKSGFSLVLKMKDGLPMSVSSRK